MAAVRGFRFGKLGNLIEVCVPKATVRNLPQILVVMDVNVTMGHNVTLLLNRVLPAVLLANGYPKDSPIDVITYSHQSTNLAIDGARPTIATLKSSVHGCAGETRMIGLFALLHYVLFIYSQSVSRQPVLMIGFSNSLTPHIEEVIGEAQFWRAQMPMVALDTVMIRLQTADTNQGDTQALTCLAMYGEDASKMFDVDCRGREDSVRKRIAEILKPHLTSQCVYIKEGQNKALLVYKDPFVAFLGTEVKELVIDGNLVPVVFEDQIPEPIFRRFCRLAQNSIKAGLVLGDVRSRDTQQFFLQLDRQLLVPFLQPVPNIEERIQRLKKLKEVEVLRGLIRDVTSLPQQMKCTDHQLADFLRAEKHGEEQKGNQSDVKLQLAVENLIRELKQTPVPQDIPPNVPSFYSACTNQESLDLIRLNLQPTDFTQTDEVLRLVGLLGIAYKAVAEDRFDPYTFTITQLYQGTFLSSSDIQEAKRGAKTVQAPGHDDLIAGMVPLRFFNPKLFDLFFTHAQHILQLQSSRNIRCKQTSSINDSLAERIAVMTWVMEANADYTKIIPAWQRTVFDDLQYQLRVLVSDTDCIKIQASIASGILAFRSYLELHDVSLHQLLVAVATLPSHPDFASLWRVIFEFDCHQRTRRQFHLQGSTKVALCMLFNLRLQQIVERAPLKNLEHMEYATREGGKLICRKTKLQEVARAASQSLSVNWTVPETKVSSAAWSWVPSLSSYKAYNRFLGDQKEGGTGLTKRDQIIALVTAIQGVCEFGDAARVFFWDNQQAAIDFVTSVVRGLFEEYYVVQAEREMKRRDEEQLLSIGRLMIDDKCHLERFVEYLKMYVPTRECDAYEYLRNEVVTRKGVIKQQKLAVLLTSRNMDDSFRIVWNQGFDPNFWSYSSLFPPDVWTRIVELRRSERGQVRGVRGLPRRKEDECVQG